MYENTSNNRNSEPIEYIVNGEKNMLVTKQAYVIINGRNVKHLESKGYEIPKELDNKGRLRTPRGTGIFVKVEDLSKGSHTLVAVKCDYCGRIVKRPYRAYLKWHDDNFGDCCPKCIQPKYHNTLIARYNVESAYEIPGIKEKMVASNLRNLGVEYPLQSKIVREKSEETCMRKYGVRHLLENKDYLQKIISSKNWRDNVISKPQRKVYEILRSFDNDYCELEVPIDRCSADILFMCQGIKIDVEYDGYYWHKDSEQKDKNRDKFFIINGYKVFRIKSKNGSKVPTEKQLRKAIDWLLESKAKYLELTI